MKQTTKLYLIIVGLCALLVMREIKHAQRVYNATQRLIDIEYEIDDIKADYYNDGFNACMEQF